jgi:hypothetical protein
MNNSLAHPPTLMSGKDFRESLRERKPRVFVDGRAVDSVADEPALQPGINAIALTYDLALQARYAPLMTAVQQTSGRRVNRLSHINTSSGDLLYKLEAVRLVCQDIRLRTALPHPRRAERHLPGLGLIDDAPRHRATASASSIICTACRTRT